MVKLSIAQVVGLVIYHIFHPQPEVYVYKFDRPQGFGAAFIGEDTFRTETNAYVAIPGGDIHPQVTAPGYAMWYSWMIRHLPDDPWGQNSYCM